MKKNLLWGSTILLLLFYLFLSSFSSLAALPGDFNSDGKVDFEDLMLFALAYGSTPGSSNWNDACDLESDGKIDFEDLMVFAMNYGKAEEPDTTISIAAIPGITTPVAGETPVTAITETDEYNGTVTWSPADATFGYSTVYTATITLTAKEGYTFTGVAADFFTVAGATATNYADSGVVTAVFPATEQNPVYIVTYNGNNNTSGTAPVDSNQYAEGANVTVIGNTGSLEKTGYNFNGWNTAADGTGTDYVPGETFVMGTSNVTLYAQWTHSLTLIAGTGGSVHIEGGLADNINYGEYYEGSKVEIVATHDRGYQLILWEAYIGDVANIDDTSSPITTVTMNEDMFIIANFEECTPEEYFVFDKTTGTITGYDTTGGLDVVIPRMIDGVLVEHIGDEAFYEIQLNSLTIADSVTTIGRYAFYKIQLNSLTLGNSVTDIGDYAFYDNNLTSSLTLGDSVVTIGYAAFALNDLSSLTLGNSVTTIGENAFLSNQLTLLTLGNSVTTIGRGAFSFNALTSLIIPNSVTTIYDQAFADNWITPITIGADVDIGSDSSTMGWNTGFKAVYDDGGKLAGTYNYTGSGWVKQ